MSAPTGAGAIRKIVTSVSETHTDVGRAVDVVTRRAVVAAVIANPWHGLGYVDDLQPLVSAIAPTVTRAITDRVTEALGGPDAVTAFGKAAIVGVDGEIEHGAALIHTPHFGDVYRAAVDGTSIIAFSDHRGAAGTPIVVPIWHKTASATRSHYQTIELWIADAPGPGEIVVAGAGSTGPRPNARIGDRLTDPAAAVAESAL
ncbi:MAG: hypothetical protein QOF29_2087 [bacterium]